MAGRTDVDLVLVNPSGRARVYQSLAAELAAVENPVWAGLMASTVREVQAMTAYRLERRYAA